MNELNMNPAVGIVVGINRLDFNAVDAVNLFSPKGYLIIYSCIASLLCSHD